jgi:DNA-binding PadR family transcriptional regulator
MARRNDVPVLHVPGLFIGEAVTFGLDAQQLARLGYKPSPGTPYPILHGLEERGLPASTEEHSGSAARRVYRATPAGVAALAGAHSVPPLRANRRRRPDAHRDFRGEI